MDGEESIYHELRALLERIDACLSEVREKVLQLEKDDDDPDRQ